MQPPCNCPPPPDHTQVERTVDTLFCQPILLQHRINQKKGGGGAKANVAAR